MIKEAIGVAATIEEARKMALENLHAPVEADVKVEVVTFPKKKVLGLFGGADAQVKASYDDGVEEKKETPKKEKKPAPAKEVKTENKKKPENKKPQPKKEVKKEAPKKEAAPAVDLSGIEAKETPESKYANAIDRIQHISGTAEIFAEYHSPALFCLGKFGIHIFVIFIQEIDKAFLGVKVLKVNGDHSWFLQILISQRAEIHICSRISTGSRHGFHDAGDFIRIPNLKHQFSWGLQAGITVKRDIKSLFKKLGQNIGNGIGQLLCLLGVLTGDGDTEDLRAVEQQPVGVNIGESLEDFNHQIEARLVSSRQNVRQSRGLYFE